MILFVWSAKVRQLCDCVYLILLIFEPRLKGKFVSHFNFQSAFPSSEDVKSSWTYRSSGGPSCQTYGHGLVAGLWVFSALTDPKTIQDLRNGDGENFEAWGWPERAQSPEVRDVFSPKNKAKVKWVKWASRITGSIFRSSTSALALQFFFVFVLRPSRGTRGIPRSSWRFDFSENISPETWKQLIQVWVVRKIRRFDKSMQIRHNQTIF